MIARLNAARSPLVRPAAFIPAATRRLSFGPEKKAYAGTPRLATACPSMFAAVMSKAAHSANFSTDAFLFREP